MTDLDEYDDEAPEEDDEPDFAAIYEPHVNGDGWRMTPRMAWRLWTSAVYLADEWRCNSPASMLRHLPPIAHEYFRDRQWRAEFVGGFTRLAERLGGVDDPGGLARCTAEELALHLVIDQTESDFINDAIGPGGTHLPSHGADDEDFHSMREVLFEDHNVLMLFDPALDGIEHDPDLATAYLHPRDWFRPFRQESAA